LLELAAQPANDKALTGLYCKETGLGLDDQTAFISFVCQIILPDVTAMRLLWAEVRHPRNDMNHSYG
jgi:hypothetical protein